MDSKIQYANFKSALVIFDKYEVNYLSGFCDDHGPGITICVEIDPSEEDRIQLHNLGWYLRITKHGGKYWDFDIR